MGYLKRLVEYFLGEGSWGVVFPPEEVKKVSKKKKKKKKVQIKLVKGKRPDGK